MGDSTYRYCPYDGTALVPSRVHGREHPSCPTCGFIDYGNPKPCVAFLVIEGGKVLLARRGVEPARGKWDVPGGFIDPGESAEEAVVREALEETGLHVRVTQYLGSVPDTYAADRVLHTLNLCYAAEAEPGTPLPQSDVEALAWFAADEMPVAMAFPHQVQVLAWCRDLLGRRA